MREYYYIVSSLPMLEFGEKPTISYEDFLNSCRTQLSPCDMEIIEKADEWKEWGRFSIALRNEIAVFRAAKKSKDPAKYIHGDDNRDPLLIPSAHWAVNLDSPLEAERFLDQLRWEKLEELSKGHYFDIDFLVTYALKLQILERWQTINSQDGMQVLESLAKETSSTA